MGAAVAEVVCPPDGTGEQSVARRAADGYYVHGKHRDEPANIFEL
jgi:hypothetical protein